MKLLARTAAFIALALLVVANLTMRTRLPNVRERPPAEKPRFMNLLTDVPYWFLIIGWVLLRPSSATSNLKQFQDVPGLLGLVLPL